MRLSVALLQVCCMLNCSAPTGPGTRVSAEQTREGVADCAIPAVWTTALSCALARLFRPELQLLDSRTERAAAVPLRGCLSFWRSTVLQAVNVRPVQKSCRI